MLSAAGSVTVELTARAVPFLVLLQIDLGGAVRVDHRRATP